MYFILFYNNYLNSIKCYSSSSYYWCVSDQQYNSNGHVGVLLPAFQKQYTQSLICKVVLLKVFISVCSRGCNAFLYTILVVVKGLILVVGVEVEVETNLIHDFMVAIFL